MPPPPPQKDASLKPPKAPEVEGLKVGKTATKELFDFNACFQAMAEKSEAGEALRVEGFKSADPNGNGLCSLAELESFILKKLMAAYPKDKTTKIEKGRDLFDLYRPCMIRAFKDAADYAKDDGVTIKGTKSAKQDDFVSKDEFRLFCAYLCIYATMYDAFSKIDGGGAGRVGDDRRIDQSEWLAGYKGVSQHGFLAFQGIENKEAALNLFQQIDNNGGGYILLEEWCEYIKAIEIKENTPLGAILAEDEEGGVGKKWVPPTAPVPTSPSKVTTPKRRSSKKPPTPKSSSSKKKPPSPALVKSPSTGEPMIMTASTGDWERDKKEFESGARRSVILHRTQKLLDKKKDIDSKRAAASATAQAVEISEDEKQMNGAPEGPLFNAVIIESNELTNFGELSDEEIMEQFQSSVISALAPPITSTEEGGEEEEEEASSNSATVAVPWNEEFDALTFLRRVLLHAPHLLNSERLGLLIPGIVRCCRNSRSILAKNAVICTEDIFTCCANPISEGGFLLSASNNEGVAMLISVLIDLSSSTASKIMRGTAQSSLTQLTNSSATELLVMASQHLIGQAGHKNKDSSESAMVFAEKVMTKLTQDENCQLQDQFDLKVMLPLLSIGVNGKSPTGKKSARECCIMLANKITPSVFTESVNSTDLSDLQKEELISIACPAPVEVVEVEEVKKEESYFDRRKRELEAEEEEMDIFVKKFLGRLGYSDDSIAKVEKIGVRCFSDLNDLAIQDDAIDLMEQAGLKKIEARKLLGEMSKRIAEEKQRKLEQKAKEDQIAAEKARLLKEKLHEEKIAQIAEEKKKKREEAEALALENKFKKEKEKEAEEERLNQTKAKQLEEWETEKNKRQALIEKGDVIEGPIEVPVKGRMGLITHKPRYAIFDTTSCILKIYEEGEYTVLSEHFVVAGLAVQKGKVGLRNKKYRVDVPLMTIENSLKIKSQLVCSTLFTLFVVQNCESFIPHESIAQYHFNTSEEAEKWCFVWNGNDEGNKIVNERLETEKEKAKELQKIKEEEDKIRKEELKKEKDLKKLKKDLQLKEKKELEKKEKDQKSSSSSSTSRQPKDGEAPKENPTSNTEGTSTATSPSAAVNKDGVEVPTTEVPKTSTETGNEEESALEADSQSVASASTKSPKSKGSRLSLTKAMSSVTKGIKSPKLSTSSSRKSIFK